MKKTFESQSNHLENLFEVRLQYQKGMPPVTSSEGKVGKYLGSGDGNIEGEKLQGSMRWSIFETIGEVCQTNIAGVIETDDGAKILFDAIGFGTRPNSTEPNKWSMLATLKFQADLEIDNRILASYVLPEILPEDISY